MDTRKSRKLAKITIAILIVASVGLAMASIGRFTPTHAIAEPVYCGACHTDQMAELNDTTHLAHFSQAIYDVAEQVGAGGTTEMTTAEAVSGACMMCHTTWNSRDMIYVNGYNLATNVNDSSGNVTDNYRLTFNDIVLSKTNSSVMYDVFVNTTAGDQFVRLGTNISVTKVYVQDAGTSGYTTGATIAASNYTTNSTGITLLQAGSAITALNNNGSVRIAYKLNSSEVRSLKEMWGELSALSPTKGVFYDDKAGKDSCGNSEKGVCHAVEYTLGLNMNNKIAENNLGVSGSGVFFQHDMAYTSAEYGAKQVKLCGVCHFNKLPPMTADGEPIRVDVTDTTKIYRESHGAVFETNITLISSDWAHKQVQCIRCHSHAGIGPEDGLTGVRSN